MPAGYAVIGEIHCSQDWGTCGASQPAERPTAGRKVIAVAVRSLKTQQEGASGMLTAYKTPQTAAESIFAFDGIFLRAAQSNGQSLSIALSPLARHARTTRSTR